MPKATAVPMFEWQHPTESAINDIGDEAHKIVVIGDEADEIVVIWRDMTASWWSLASYQDFSAFILLGFVIGLGAGSVLLGWVYERSGASILAAATWHGTYNLVAASGDSAVRSSVVTAFVIAWAVSIARRAPRAV